MTPSVFSRQNSEAPQQIRKRSLEKKPRSDEPAVNINYISEQDELRDSATVLQFVLASICKGLGLNSKQAAGLLADNNKYLIHVCVKGVKSDFGKVVNWYTTVYKEARALADLIEKEESNGGVRVTLGIVSAGLYSPNVDVASWAAKLLTKLGQELDERQLLG